MTRERAHLLLDAARRGWPIPEREITEALVATGDMEADDAFVQTVRTTWEPVQVAAQPWYVYEH